MLGYDALPESWKQPLYEVADSNFKYTDISFNRACDMSFRHALQVVERYGGKVGENDVTIKVQTPEQVRYEQSFEGLWPMSKIYLGYKDIRTVGQLSFEGRGIVVGHHVIRTAEFKQTDYEAEIEVYVDGQLDKTVLLPVKANYYKPEIYFNYDLSECSHTLDFKWLNPVNGADIRISFLLPYQTRPEGIDRF